MTSTTRESSDEDVECVCESRDEDWKLVLDEMVVEIFVVLPAPRYPVLHVPFERRDFDEIGYATRTEFDEEWEEDLLQSFFKCSRGRIKADFVDPALASRVHTCAHNLVTSSRVYNDAVLTVMETEGEAEIVLCDAAVVRHRRRGDTLLQCSFWSRRERMRIRNASTSPVDDLAKVREMIAIDGRAVQLRRVSRRNHHGMWTHDDGAVANPIQGFPLNERS